MSIPVPQSVTVQWGSEKVPISNVERTLPDPTTSADRAEVVAAGAVNPLMPLPEGALRAIGRGVVSPDSTAVQLRPTGQRTGGLLMEENVEGATLRSVVTRAWLLELFPGIQPRTGMEVMETPDPQVVGLTHDGRPCAVVQYRYQSLEHLKDHVWQTVHGTLSINNYATSILARKVTRNLITHPVEFTFEDGTESFHALVVRDGITRLASAWKVLAGPGADAAEAAELARDSLFGAVPAKASGGSLGERLAAAREDVRAALAREFVQESAGLEPGTRAIQIAQTYVVPAQIAVGAQAHPGHLLAPEDVFDDAMRSILASVHVEFKQWDDSAQNVEVATRALKRVIQQGDAFVDKDSLQAVYGLAVGRISPADFPRAFNQDEIPATALWRGVYLVHALTRPELIEQLKDQAKAIKGGKRMGLKGFAELLGPLVDLPWRSYKKAVATQARNAWKNGGVLTEDVMKPWEPVPTDDFTTLVPLALAGDTNARCTLAVAGGTALIADKLLTRNVGSALLNAREKGGVPFRADVGLVVQELSRHGNEEGLWLLALAANRFRSDQLPENAVTYRQFIRKTKGTGAADASAYVHFKADLAQPDRIARDQNGVPVPLYQWDVVWASDEARARKTVAAQTTPALPPVLPVVPVPAQAAGVTGGPADDAAEDTRPPSRRAADHRRVLRHELSMARDSLDQLLALDGQVGGHTAVIGAEDLDGLRQNLLDLLTDVENLRRAVHGDAGEEADEDEPADAV
ncbi:hypothetical protein ACWDYJ_32835 [Streptomyces sp. NPDC003042]